MNSPQLFGCCVFQLLLKSNFFKIGFSLSLTSLLYLILFRYFTTLVIKRKTWKKILLIWFHLVLMRALVCIQVFHLFQPLKVVYHSWKSKIIIFTNLESLTKHQFLEFLKVFFQALILKLKVGFIIFWFLVVCNVFIQDILLFWNYFSILTFLKKINFCDEN